MGIQAMSIASFPALGGTANTDYFLCAPDILLAIPRDGACDDALSAQANVRFQQTFGEKLGRPYGLVTLMGTLLDQGPEARRTYIEGWDPGRCFGSAMVVSGPLSRAIGSFYVGLNRPRVPTELFGTVEAALAWLMDQAGRGSRP